MVKRLFLGNQHPLPVSIAAKLAALKPATPPDFGKILLVLPGKVARRNVRNELLKHYPGGILLPQLLTPHLLMHYQRQESPLPGAVAEELIWGRVLTKAAAHKEDFTEFFFDGNVPAEKFMAAGKLRQLRAELAAGGFSIADAACHLGTRGGDLCDLEHLYCRELTRYGFADPLAADREAVSDNDAFAGVEKIILAALPDLPRMLREKLAAIDEKFPGMIEVWIGDEAANSDFYDQWGVPIPEKWENRAFECDIDHIHVALDPADAAHRAMMLAAGNGVFDPSECAIVLADQSLYADFAGEFERLSDENGNRVKVIDPSGVPMGRLRLCRLAGKLLEFLHNADDFLYAAELLRQDDFLAYAAGSKEREKFLLMQLDAFQLEMMADDFTHAVQRLAGGDRYALLREAMQLISDWKKRFENLDAAGFIREFFTGVYRQRHDLPPVCEVTFDRECEFFTGLLADFAALPEKLCDAVDKIQLLEIFFRIIRESRITAQVPPGALAFEGRLEMPFLTRKRLIFCGMNENLFPDRINHTTFLTDSIRSKIGIRSNRETLARSLYHLLNVCQVRQPGDVHLISLRMDGEQSALRPSGIFFGGDLPEKELLKRCAKLFRDPIPLPMPENAPGNKEFFLKPEISLQRDEDGKLNLSVTTLDSYLSSPFVCCWEKVLGMQSVDYSLCEPDPALAGTLCHAAFEKLPPHRRFASAEEMEKCLCAGFDAELARRYGSPLPVLLSLYAANMKQRFVYGAQELFRSQNDGFELLCTEYKFGGEKGYIPYKGANFRGKVDRIEYNRAGNILRVIDIKTGKVDDVISEHCRFDRQKKFAGFVKLQLPLYVLLLKEDQEFRKICPEIDSAEIECAYLALPPEVTSSRLHLWPADKLAAILDDAADTVGMIVARMERFADMEITGDPAKVGIPLLQPDILRTMPDIRWLDDKENKSSDDKPAKGKTTKKSAVPELKKEFPKLPVLDQAGATRCCDCPPEIRANCGCCHGDCSDCKNFNGFKSFNLITASAGTGKTYALASRFIQLLDFGADPESILAITFTKPAAGEIFDRVVRRICTMATEPEKAANCCRRIGHDRIISLIRKLLGNHTKELQISTIDSFFMQILQTFAPELGIWGEISMTDENDDRLMRKTLHRWIRSIRNQEQLDILRELLKEAASGDTRSIHFALYKLINDVYHFFQLKIQKNSDGSMPQLADSPWDSTGGLLKGDELDAVIDGLKLEAQAMEETGNATSIRRFQALAGQLEKCSSGVLYGKLDDDVADLLGKINEKNGEYWLEDEDDMPLNYWRYCNPRPTAAQLLRKAFRHIRTAALRQCRAKNLAVFGLIGEYDRIYSETVRSAGNITFSDLPTLLATRDKENNEIILGPYNRSIEFRLDRQIRHYMFDEFQDTSDVQMRVFNPLLVELFSQLDRDSFRSFFCVGDIKQSIYQWRGGNPELFNYIHNLLRPIGEQLNYDPADSLVRSYRSSQAVLDTVNAVFCTYDGKFENFKPAHKKLAYLPHISSDPAMPGHTALINVAQSSPHTAQNFAAKSRIMAEIIREICPLERNMTVGVLVPTNDVAKEFARILRSEYGLPVSVDGKISPVDSMAFNVFRELLILAGHPGDQEAQNFLAMLCFAAPEDDHAVFTPEILAEKLGFSPALPLAESVREEIFLNGLSGFARKFMEAFSPECTAFDRERLEILCSAANKFNGSTDDFLRQVDRLGKNDSSLQGTIQLMTCHKSKGLEFDIVFMPDPTIHNANGSSYLPEAQIIRYDENNDDWLLESDWVSYMPHKAIAANVPALAAHLKEKEIDRVLEKSCALYVAMTRAKSALYILTSRNNPDGSFAPDRLLMEQLAGFGAQNSDTFLADLLAAPELSDAAPEMLFSHGNWHWYIQQHPEIETARPAESFTSAALPAVRREIYREYTASGGKDEFFSVKPEKRFDPVSGKNVGSEVHALFEKLRFADDTFDPAAFCQEYPVSSTAGDIFCSAMAADSPIRAALQQPDGEYELWCERRFLLVNHRGETVPGAFDRVVIFKENGVPVSAHIIDYKSDRFDSPEEFAIYFPQLTSYRESLAMLLNIPGSAIRCSIFALKIRQIIDVEPQNQ
ncbi:MAG: hypothetical protein E7053_00575 [Lentisphaerae bacterium]|nr:hypothetical protein [Lentisphaerota bacterium]